MFVQTKFQYAAIALFLSMTGCATVPPHLIDPVATPHVDCDPKTHFWALGTSVESREDAIASARSSVIAQVSSEIDSVVQNQSTLTYGSGGASTQGSQTRAMTQRSRFAHAELVALVPPVMRVEGKYRALACLDRERAAAAERAAIESLFASACRSLKDALDAAERLDRRTFVVSRRDALGSSPRLRESMDQLRALRGRLLPEEEQYLSELRRLSEVTTQMRSETRVHIWLDDDHKRDLAAELRSGVPQALRDALLKMGIKGAMTEKDPCGQGRSDIILRIMPRQSCAWGRLGHTCQLQLPTRVESCTKSTTARDDERHTRLVGEGDLAENAAASHPREEKYALARLVKILPLRVEAPLYTLLSPELPLDLSDSKDD